MSYPWAKVPKTLGDPPDDIKVVDPPVSENGSTSPTIMASDPPGTVELVQIG